MLETVSINERIDEMNKLIRPFVWHEKESGECSVYLNVETSKLIRPFVWHEKESGECSVYLNIETSNQSKNGYTWATLAFIFLESQMPEVLDEINISCGLNLFFVFSDDREALKNFIINFREACDNNNKLIELLNKPKKELSKKVIYIIAEHINKINKGERDCNDTLSLISEKYEVN